MSTNTTPNTSQQDISGECSGDVTYAGRHPYTCGVDPAILVANWFISKSQVEHRLLSIDSIHKFIYLTYGSYFSRYDHPLFGESVEAWDRGPTVSVIHHAHKGYNEDEVNKLLSNNVNWGKHNTGYSRHSFSDHTHRCLDRVWDGFIDDITDSTLTKEKDSPWHEVWYTLGGHSKAGVVIPNDIIKGYFDNHHSKDFWE